MSSFNQCCLLLCYALPPTPTWTLSSVPTKKYHPLFSLTGTSPKWPLFLFSLHHFLTLCHDSHTVVVTPWWLQIRVQREALPQPTYCMGMVMSCQGFLDSASRHIIGDQKLYIESPILAKDLPLIALLGAPQTFQQPLHWLLTRI